VRWTDVEIRKYRIAAVSLETDDEEEDEELPPFQLN